MVDGDHTKIIFFSNQDNWQEYFILVLEACSHLLLKKEREYMYGYIYRQFLQTDVMKHVTCTILGHTPIYRYTNTSGILHGDFTIFYGEIIVFFIEKVKINYSDVPVIIMSDSAD